MGTDLAQVKADMLKRLKSGCCCFQNVYFSEHNGVPGSLTLAGDVITPRIVQMIQNAANQAAQQIAQESLRHQQEFLHFVSKFMCKGGKVTFVECKSGSGPEGQALQEWLKGIFGNNVTVTLFSGDVKWSYGSPSCSQN